jgi:META domain
MSRVLVAALGILWLCSLIGGSAASRVQATPARQEAVPPGTWELRAIVYADGSEAIPVNPALHTIAFFPGERSVIYADPDDQQDAAGTPDGRIGLQLDCNVGSADYLVDGNRLTIISVLSTNVGCLPLTLGEEFADRLLGVTSFALEGEELVFFLEDGGRLRFAPLGAGTPAAVEKATGPARAVVPAECQVQPYPLAELAGLRDLPGEVSASTPSAIVIAVPLGPEAPERTVTAVNETVLGYLACRNAGDLPRAAVYLTDAGTRRILGRAVALAATPVVLPPQTRTRLIALTDVTILPDGRVAAIALINDPRSLPRGRQTVLLFFVWEDESLLIDDLIGFTVPTVLAATPSAGSTTP